RISLLLGRIIEPATATTGANLNNNNDDNNAYHDSSSSSSSSRTAATIKSLLANIGSLNVNLLPAVGEAASAHSFHAHTSTRPTIATTSPLYDDTMMTSNSFTSYSYENYSLKQRLHIAYDWCASILSIASLILNVFIIIMLLWQKKTQKTPTNHLQLQLSLTGILFSLLILIDASVMFTPGLDSNSQASSISSVNTIRYQETNMSPQPNDAIRDPSNPTDNINNIDQYNRLQVINNDNRIANNDKNSTGDNSYSYGIINRSLLASSVIQLADNNHTLNDDNFSPGQGQHSTASTSTSTTNTVSEGHTETVIDDDYDDVGNKFDNRKFNRNQQTTRHATSQTSMPSSAHQQHNDNNNNNDNNSSTATGAVQHQRKNSRDNKQPRIAPLASVLLPLIINTLQTVHIWTVVALSIDRFSAISNPLNYMRYLYARRTFAFISIAWICAIVMNIVIPTSFDYYYYHSPSPSSFVDDQLIGEK
ncbi:hypothetical protein GZH46_01600, partial [Fragariocoptes setiger]